MRNNPDKFFQLMFVSVLNLDTVIDHLAISPVKSTVQRSDTASRKAKHPRRREERYVAKYGNILADNKGQSGVSVIHSQQIEDEEKKLSVS